MQKGSTSGSLGGPFAEGDTRSKISFALWGIRYLDILVLMAYPTMGAVFAADLFYAPNAARFALFTLFNFLFVAHVYIFNDLSDALLNPEEPRRRRRHALKYPAFTRRQTYICSGVMALLAFSGFAYLSWRLFWIAVLIEALTMLYSHPRINLKGKPVVSTLIHFLGAVLYFLGGWSLFEPFSLTGICLSVFFGLVLAGGHFSNEIDDFDYDLAAGIRTNAIAYGKRKVFQAGLLLFVLSSGFLLYISLYCLDFFLYPIIACLMLITWTAQVIAWRSFTGRDDIREFRRFYRMLYAILCLAFLIVRMYLWLGLSSVLPAGH